MMRSGLGEYTPDEFLVILTALERVVGVVEKVAAHCRLVLPKDAPGYWTAVLPPDVIAEVARATAEINGYGGDDDHG